MTPKEARILSQRTARILFLIASTPGITAAEIHRQMARDSAYGHAKFTYATIGRMRADKLVQYCPTMQGLKGNGLSVVAPVNTIRRTLLIPVAAILSLVAPMSTTYRTLIPLASIPSLVAGLYVASIATSVACPGIALTGGVVAALGALLATVAS